MTAENFIFLYSLLPLFGRLAEIDGVKKASAASAMQAKIVFSSNVSCGITFLFPFVCLSANIIQQKANAVKKRKAVFSIFDV